jgi:hypothetical protein
MDSLPTKVTKFFHHNELNSCSLVKASYGGSVFSLERIFSFFQQKNLGNFGEMYFSSVISTNFTISKPNFCQNLTSEIWK